MVETACMLLRVMHDGSEGYYTSIAVYPGRIPPGGSLPEIPTRWAVLQRIPDLGVAQEIPTAPESPNKAENIRGRKFCPNDAGYIEACTEKKRRINACRRAINAYSK